MTEHRQDEPGHWPPPAPPRPGPPGSGWDRPDVTTPLAPPEAGPGGPAPPVAMSQSSVTTGLPLGRLGLVATVLVLAGLGGFAVWRALDGPRGAATPEEAAAGLFEAAEREDLLGVIETMLPSEREAMVEPMTDMMIELARLEVLDDDTVDGGRLADDISGLTFDVPAEGEPGALVYEVQPLGTSDTIRWVTVTDGDLTVTFDPTVAREALGDRLGRLVDRIDPDPDARTQTEIIDLGREHELGNPLQFAVVEEDGSWYFSLWYTVAGFATDGRAPDLALAATPVGAASPEEAASRFLENLVELELTGAMGLLDPDEFRAAYDYWGEFGPELADGAARLRGDAAAEGVTWEVVSVRAGSEERNGRTVATIDAVTIGFTSTAEGAMVDLTVTLGADGLAVDGTIQGAPFRATIDRERAVGRGTIDGQAIEFDVDLLTYEGFAVVGPDRFDLVRRGDCLLVTINRSDTEEVCGDDIGTASPFASLDLQRDYQELIDEVGNPGLTVVERDGRWYVSGFPTYAHSVVDILRVMEPEELDELLASYEDLLEDLDAFDL